MSKSCYKLAVQLLTLLFLLSFATPSWSQVSVWTQHNDNRRTGANLNETVLSTANVNPSQFGKLFSQPVDGEIYAQPLYIPGVTIPGKGVHNVVYVATMQDSVYAFDADTNTGNNSAPLWSVNFTNAGAGITPVPQGDGQQNSTNIHGPVGIIGTPVIDQNSKTIYLVARTKENGAYFQRLHALDITTGAERPNSPVVINPTVAGSGASSRNGVVAFDSLHENQRPGLALYNGVVYIMWASLTDLDPYHGWILGFDETSLAQVAVFNTTPNGGRGGIWQSGQGPAIDANGYMYLQTGNGDWDPAIKNNYGSSMVKLNTGAGLAPTDYFTPSDWLNQNQGDLDLGSGGVLLLPNTNLAVGGGKEGILYSAPTNNLGHLQTTNSGTQSFQATIGHIHGAPVYWNSPTKGPLIYVWGERSYLRAYHYNGTNFDTTAVMNSTFTAPPGMPGGFLSISANASQPGSGILWANMPYNSDAENADVPGVLRAFDASDLTKELWNSHQSGTRDDFGTFAKFTPPTVANGKVYLSTFSNQLWVYGLFNANPDFALSSAQATASVGVGGTASYTVSLQSINGFNQAAGLSVQGLPSGATAAFNPTAIAAGQSSVLSVTTPANIVPGSYTLTVTGAAGSTSHQLALTLLVHAGSASGSISGTTSVPGATVDLGVIGTTDWVHWGLNGAGTLDRKAGVTAQISNLTLVGNGGLIGYGNNPFGFKWAGGTPTQNVGSTATGVYTVGLGNGFQVTVPADTTTRTVTIYAGVYQAAAKLVASLSDNSSVNYVDTTVMSPQAQKSVAYSLTYQAASPGQTLTISVTQDSEPMSGMDMGATGNGNVTLQAAALQSGQSAGNPEFTIAASPGVSTVVAGATGTYAVTTAAVGGFTGGVALSVQGLPTGATATFNPASITGAGTSSLSVATTGSVVPGTYAATITGTSGTLQHSAKVSLVINAGGGGGAAGILTGVLTQPTTTQDLTAAGTSDWVHWGYSDAYHPDRKAAVTPQISDYTPVGGGTYTSYGNNPFNFQWSDGTPHDTVVTNSAIYVAGQGKGFQVTAPADTTTRAFTIYAGIWNSRLRITASLSDTSAAGYSDNSVLYMQGSKSIAYTFSYRAATAGQTLTVTVTQDDPSGNVTLQAATLALAGVGGAAPDYSVLTSPSTQTVFPGQSATYSVLVPGVNGFAGTVSLNVQGLPNGATAAFDDAAISGTQSAALTVSTTGSIPAGSYNFTVVGTSGSLTHQSAATLVVSSAAPGKGSLSGALNPSQSPTDLTAIGTGDWVHWGLTGPNSLDRKAGVTPAISNFTAVGGFQVQSYYDHPVQFQWTDGAPTGSSVTSSGVYIAGQGGGFQITAPADTVSRTLTLFVGVWKSQARLSASLSDNSDSPYVDTSLVNLNGALAVAYTLTYQAASAGQHLTVTYTQASAGGNVTVQGAALSVAGQVSGTAPDFGITASPSSTSVTAGAAGSYSVATTVSNGFANALNLSAQGLPAGATATFSPGSIVGGSSSTMTVSTTNATSAGAYAITITGTSGALQHQATVTLVVASGQGGGTAAGALSGSVLTLVTDQNLTALGTADWIHWGLTSPTQFDRKAGVTPQLSNFSILGKGPVFFYTNNPTGFQWIDGAPDQSIATNSGVYIWGQGNGFQIAAPASTTARKLIVYVGVFQSQAKVTASLSDNSGPVYTDATTVNLDGLLSVAYTFTYKAATAGQSLNVSIVQTSTTGNVSLQAAALQ